MKKTKQPIMNHQVAPCSLKQGEVKELMAYLRTKGQSPVDRMKKNFSFLAIIDSLIEEEFSKHGADFHGEHLLKMKSSIEADIRSLAMSLEYEIEESEISEIGKKKILVKPQF